MLCQALTAITVVVKFDPPLGSSPKRGIGRWRFDRKRLLRRSRDSAASSLLKVVDTIDRSFMGELGVPGEFPFTRHSADDVPRPFVDDAPVRGFGTAAESNQRYRYLLAQGVDGLSVAFDLPTQMGYDSDHVLAQGEVGRVGVAIDSIEDMAALFEGDSSGPRVHVDDDQFHGGDSAGALRRRGLSVRTCRCRNYRARFKTTS